MAVSNAVRDNCRVSLTRFAASRGNMLSVSGKRLGKGRTQGKKVGADGDRERGGRAAVSLGRKCCPLVSSCR